MKKVMTATQKAFHSVVPKSKADVATYLAMLIILVLSKPGK